jgi:hypothetical protein
MPRLTYANVMASAAVFIALGGTSYAAITVTGKEVRNGSLTGVDLRDGSVTSRDLARGVLRPAARDGLGGAAAAAGATSAAGAKGDRGEPGPAGPKGDPGARGDTGATGETGATGATGAKGETGTVDTSAFYTKAASDARFLAKDTQVVHGKAEVARVRADVSGYVPNVLMLGAYNIHATCHPGSAGHSLIVENYYDHPTGIVGHDGVRTPESARDVLIKTFVADGSPREWRITADSSDGTLSAQLSVQPRPGGGCEIRGTATLAE